MPRVQFTCFGGTVGKPLKLRIALPGVVPQGYTPVMYVAEWLTLNCTSDWACRSKGKVLTILFETEADCARAAARFGPSCERVIGIAERRPPQPSGVIAKRSDAA